MNIKKIVKTLPVHAIGKLQAKELKVVVTLCGRWLEDNGYEQTSEPVTCKRCLQYLAGGETKTV